METPDVPAEELVAAGGEGYLAFQIQLPTNTSSTRANDEFNDGDPVPDEYKVQNAHLVLFTGTTEAGAKFCGAYPLGISSFNTVGSATDQCTTEGQATAKITKPTVATNLYAYVIINHNGLVASPSATGVTLGGTPVTDATSFADFSRIILNKIGDTSTGMVMTNCPVNGNVGGSSAPTAALTTLASLDPSKIYPTAAAAEADPAGEVYVERAAAKVTVTQSIVTAELTTKPGVTYNKATIKWVLNNENQVYFNNRQMQAAWVPYVAFETAPKNDGTIRAASKYRMVSNAAIHTGVFRTYWGEDVNYNMDKADFATNNVEFKANPAASAITKAMGTSVYTTENTFDVDHQSSQYTTQVALAVTFNGAADFYTANTYGANNILQVPGYTGSEEKVQDYIMTYLVNNNTEFKTWYDAKAENRITVTMTNGSDGHATVNTLVKASASADALPVSITPALVNSAITFNYYAGGLAYYHVRIQHFGNDETPWTRTNHDENNIAGVYKKVGATALTDAEAALNYLGRYGVLRNNWYQIDVTGIKQIGTPLPGDPNDPVDPFTPDTPDDEVENYISVKIHVTPWAIRRQSVVL